MAPAPAEIDVFSGPHSRMKRLVQLYSEKLTEVDLSSCSDLRALLWSLKSTFTEFKTHEHIENECIMWRLKNRLQFLKIEIDAVSEVHSDNQLSEMLQLVEEGCTQADRCQCPKEAATIGQSLAKALTDFTKDFLPHMQEEEEFFQPLLMEYFSYSELKEIKSDVIQRHQQLTKYCVEEKEGFENQSKDITETENRDACENIATESEEEEDDLDDNTLSKIQGLPTEILLKIFSYLNPRELCQSSMVCVRWSSLARDPSLWKHLYPARWARGDWKFGASIDLTEEEDNEGGGYESDVYVVVDEDADFDESASSVAESDSSNTSQASYTAECIRREAHMLVTMAKYLLPYVGEGVETVNLAGSKGITNGLVYKLLVQCPNLQHLCLSETKVSDIAFKGLSKNGVGCNLRHLDLSGCTNITDLTLQRLASIQQKREPSNLASNVENSATCRDDSLNHSGRSTAECMHGSDKNGRPLVAKNRTGKEHKCCSSSQCHSKTKSRTDNRSRHHGNTSQEVQCHMTFAPRTGSCHTVGSENNNRSSCHGNSERSDDKGEVEERALERRLEFLSLSGCYRITDEGLRILAQGGGWPNLRHLDMSGCLNVSAQGLSQLAEACPSLDHEEFFYCDNIIEGPYADTASGCQNLQCRNRVCCRSGE